MAQGSADPQTIQHFSSLAALLAIVSHLTILRRVEVDHLVRQLIAASTLAFGYVAYNLGFQPAFLIWTSFYVTLTASILIYRAFFHPLRNFPGPPAAKLSKWWTVIQNVSSNYTFHTRMYPLIRQKYGDYVRTGPREITIFDAKAIPSILGTYTKTSKGPFYDILERSLQLTRDKTWHRQRRKIWDNSLKDSLADYSPRIEEFTTEFLARIQKANGEPVPLHEYLMHYAYDVMATMAFGKPIGFTAGTADPVSAEVVEMICDNMKFLGVISHIPWLSKAFTQLTANIGPMKLYNGWTKDHLNQRINMKDPKPDLMMHLLAATPQTPEGQHLLFGEARLIITAGSETLSATLTMVFILLALYPNYQTLLRQESEATDEFSCMRAQPLLDGIVYESMRLYPPVFFLPQRVTPPEGLQLPDGPFIPGNMIVSISLTALARDERNFVQSADFIPERWTTRPELCIDKSAFLPFLTGSYTCAGKALALMEMRSVVRRVIDAYDVVLPDEFDEKAFFGAIQDPSLAMIPKQYIRFIKRG